MVIELKNGLPMYDTNFVSLFLYFYKYAFFVCYSGCKQQNILGDKWHAHLRWTVYTIFLLRLDVWICDTEMILFIDFFLLLFAFLKQETSPMGGNDHNNMFVLKQLF